MKIIGPAGEQHAVFAFLKAEIDSPRFGFRARLSPEGAALIDAPTIGDAIQDAARRQILGSYRGYPALLFTGWPNDFDWQLVEFDLAEIGAALYANYPSWVAVSKATRRVDVGAANLASDLEIKHNVDAIAARLKAGEVFPPLVAVTDGTRTILVEGHTRATTYVRERSPLAVQCLLGTSSLLSRWHFY